MKNFLDSLPRLFLVAAFVAGLWIVGSYLIYECVAEFRFALELQRRVEGEIAQNLPDNLKNPGERQQILRNIFYGKFLLGAMLIGAVLMVLAGFAILFWPIHQRIRQFFGPHGRSFSHGRKRSLTSPSNMS